MYYTSSECELSIRKYKKWLIISTFQQIESPVEYAAWFENAEIARKRLTQINRRNVVMRDDFGANLHFSSGIFERTEAVNGLRQLDGKKPIPPLMSLLMIPAGQNMDWGSDDIMLVNIVKKSRILDERLYDRLKVIEKVR